MKEKISPDEIGFYTGGKLSRRLEIPPGAIHEMDIVKAELRGPRWARRVRLTISAHPLTGGTVRVVVSIPLRSIRVVRAGNGQLCFGGKRYGDRPMLLWPHPDKRDAAIDYAEYRWQKISGQ